MVGIRGPRPASMSVLPNVAQANDAASDRQKIVTALAAAFGIRLLAHLDKDFRSENATKFYQTLLSQNLLAWVVMVSILALLSDFDTTRDVAVALAFLIFIAVLLQSGLPMAENVQAWIDQANKPRKPKEKKEAQTT